MYWNNEEVLVANTSVAAEESLATTFEMHVIINNSEPGQSTLQLSMTPSPRKRKLIAKLNGSLLVSRDITSMKDIIAEL